jgi:hypothetical protein
MNDEGTDRGCLTMSAAPSVTHADGAARIAASQPALAGTSRHRTALSAGHLGALA